MTLFRPRQSHRPLVGCVVLGCSIALTAGCGDSPPGEPDIPPVITISGVTDGEIRTDPVTIEVSVDRGTFATELNGEPFFPGGTVSVPGNYQLEVNARNGTAVASASIGFMITLSGDTRLIIRIFNLGANQSGGGGDAALLTDSSSAGPSYALIDAGPAGQGGSDPTFVQRQLQQLGVDTLEFMILSHAHSDHFGGMPPVLQNFHVRWFFHNDQLRNFAAYTQVLSLANQLADSVTIPSSIVEFPLGFGQQATQVAVLTPLATYLTNANADGSEINEGSLGTEVRKGPFRIFFAGDGEVQSNARWRTSFASRTSALTALKLGHHGANDAIFDNGFNGSSAWLSHTDPEIAFVSANGETHPRQNATTALLARVGLRTYCTNVHGDIEIRVDENGAYVVTVEQNTGENCAAGSDADT